MKVIVAHRFDRSLVEDESRKASVIESHVAGGADDHSVKTAIDEREVKVDVNSVIVGCDVDVVQERKQHVFVTGVKRYSGRRGEVHVELGVDGGTSLVNFLNECKNTGK